MYKIVSLVRILEPVIAHKKGEVDYVFGGTGRDFEPIRVWAESHILSTESLSDLPSRVTSSLTIFSKFSNFILSTKPETKGCISDGDKKGAADYRVNLSTGDVGVDPKHEIKGLIYRHKKTNAVHVFFLPASFEVNLKKVPGGRELRLISDLSEIGLIPYTVNPFSVLDTFVSNPGKFPQGITFHIHEQGFNEVGFVTNNVGTRFVSCSVPRDEYFHQFFDKVKLIDSPGVIRVFSTDKRSGFNVAAEDLFRSTSASPTDSSGSETVSPTDGAKKPKGPVHSVSDSSLLVHGNGMPVGGTGSSDNSEQAPQTV